MRAIVSADHINVSENMNLDCRKMRVIHTAPNGVVGPDTIFHFSQVGDVVSAHYSGGRIRTGYLVGILIVDTLSFRYCQVCDKDTIDAGTSSGRIEMRSDGRLRLIESFVWESREGRGENIFEEFDELSPNQLPDPALASGTPPARQESRHP
jgi:hypothetical protein